MDRITVPRKRVFSLGTLPGYRFYRAANDLRAIGSGRWTPSIRWVGA